ncbi:MAG: DUF192 domain-containing protein [Pelagimonas sp.]|jgi:uncharacterized membrane protein (UPF0127 family)|nr:DUF192 domain-containing protein [Pelagimonas sp.]
MGSRARALIFSTLALVSGGIASDSAAAGAAAPVLRYSEAITDHRDPLTSIACESDALQLRGDFGQVRFRIEVADTEKERAQGLMFVKSLPRFSGMLFVYDSARPVSFWMKNTYIPLDMIFADETGTVVHIHKGAVPHDLTPIPSGAPAQYVLEVNAGIAQQLGLKPGDQMRHPQIFSPAWPCF